MKQVTLDGVDVIEINDYSEDGVTEITVAGKSGEAVCMTAKGEDLEVFDTGSEVKAETTVYTDGDRFVSADILEIFDVWLDVEPTPENVEEFKRHHDDDDRFYDSEYEWKTTMAWKIVKAYDTFTEKQRKFVEKGRGADSKWS